MGASGMVFSGPGRFRSSTLLTSERFDHVGLAARRICRALRAHGWMSRGRSLVIEAGHAGGDLRGLGLPSVADDTDTTSGR